MDDIPITVVVVTAPAKFEDVVSVSKLENHAEVEGFEGGPICVS